MELWYSAACEACEACQGVDDDDNGDAGPGVQVVTVTPGMSPPCDSWRSSATETHLPRGASLNNLRTTARESGVWWAFKDWCVGEITLLS